MTEVFLERSFSPGLEPGDVLAMGREAMACFGLHRVAWRGSCLALDGARMVCHFTAPDAESARIALRQTGANVERLWAGTVHEAPRPPARPANVLVERRFEAPADIAALQAREDARAWCLEAHGVEFERSFFSLDRRRMLCLYHAPDAESVRLAQRKAGMPVDGVWAYRGLDESSFG